MLTTCPECRTSFRVSQEQLGLRRGLVRCGSCGVVFNAYDSLLAELVTPPADAVEADSMVEPPELLELPPEFPAPPEDEPALEPPPEITREAAPEIAPEPEPAPAPSPVAETPDSILLSELPNRVIKPPRDASARLKFALQFLAALLLGVSLLLQLSLFLRAEIAAHLPAARPALKALCKPFGCVVPLARQLDKSAIAASSLEHDAETPARSRLTLLLANRGAQAQAWPHIVLTLTDVRDDPVAQRVFTPVEYLPKDVIHALGMAAGEEREIRLNLDTGSLSATGYALDLAYR